MWELSIFRRDNEEWIRNVDLPALDADSARRLLGLDASAEVAGEFEVTGDALTTLSRYAELPPDMDHYAFYLGLTTDED